MNRQRVIPLLMAEDASLDDFAGVANSELVAELKQLCRGDRPRRVLYLWGAEGLGKSHLLVGCCQAASQQGRRASYLSAAGGLVDSAVDTDGLDLICVDDIDQASESLPDLQILMGMHERLVPAGGSLLVAGHSPVRQLQLVLPDLASRLSAGGTYQVTEPADDEKILALERRTRSRGYDLEEGVLRYIMTHYSRDMRQLIRLLDRLDSASLAEQRRITVPFLKAVIADLGDTRS